MQEFSLDRRRALAVTGFALAAPGWAAAASQTRLTLSTGAQPPYTPSPGQEGFLNALLGEVFRRLGIEALVQRVPAERALINANAGIDDGDAFRAPGFEADFPNLVRVPEKLSEFDFVAYAARPDVRIRSWQDLGPHQIAYVTGWKLYERNIKSRPGVTTVRLPEQLFPLLEAGRADVVLLERWQGLWLARESRVAAYVIDPPLARADMYFYLHRKHAELVPHAAAELAKLKADGTYQRIYERILKALEPAR